MQFAQLFLRSTEKVSYYGKRLEIHPQPCYPCRNHDYCEDHPRRGPSLFACPSSRPRPETKTREAQPRKKPPSNWGRFHFGQNVASQNALLSFRTSACARTVSRMSLASFRFSTVNWSTFSKIPSQPFPPKCQQRSDHGHGQADNDGDRQQPRRDVTGTRRKIEKRREDQQLRQSEKETYPDQDHQSGGEDEDPPPGLRAYAQL